MARRTNRNGESVVSSSGDVLQYRKDGGIDSDMESVTSSGEIYYMGIIDILQVSVEWLL